MTDDTDLLALKISNWESIPYSNTLQCPNGDDGDFADGNRIFIGWCDTPNGLMQVYECNICHQKYRFHGVLQERWNLQQFLTAIHNNMIIRNKLEQKSLQASSLHPSSPHGVERPKKA